MNNMRSLYVPKTTMHLHFVQRIVTSRGQKIFYGSVISPGNAMYGKRQLFPLKNLASYVLIKYSMVPCNSTRANVKLKLSSTMHT